MATSKSKAKSKPKTRTQSNQMTQFQFKWWMALILVGVVAVLGIVILRFSHAATLWESGSPTRTIPDQECQNYTGSYRWVYNQNVACTRSDQGFKGFHF